MTAHPRRAFLFALFGALTCFSPMASLTPLARADLAPSRPATVRIEGSSEGSTLVYRITNTGTETVRIGQPHLVALERGIRVPVRFHDLTVDGVARPTYELFEIAPGATVVLRLTHDGLAAASTDLELGFRQGGPVTPYRMTVGRAGA